MGLISVLPILQGGGAALPGCSVAGPTNPTCGGASVSAWNVASGRCLAWRALKRCLTSQQTPSRETHFCASEALTTEAVALPITVPIWQRGVMFMCKSSKPGPAMDKFPRMANIWTVKCA